MNIQEGWLFYSADFSRQARMDETIKGGVLLIRNKEEQQKWFALSEELQDTTDLYAQGSGYTFEEALIAANQAALKIGIL